MVGSACGVAAGRGLSPGRGMGSALLLEVRGQKGVTGDLSR